MARIQYTALVNRIAGSIAGTTFQRNAYGHTIKTKPNTVNKNTQAQAEKKALILAISKNWALMSNKDRKSWRRQAQSNPIKSRLNKDSSLNGYNYYMKYNLIQKQVRSRPILNNAGIGYAEFVFDSLSASIRGSNVTVKINFYARGDVFIAYVSMTSPLNPSLQSIRENFTFITAGSVHEEVDDLLNISVPISTQYDKKIGITLTENLSVGISVTLVHQGLGQIIEIPPQIIQIQ